MRIFIAGATGVIGIRLVPLLVEAGHEVAGMTRTLAKRGALEDAGAQAVVCDVYDAAALREAVVAFGPDLVMHQLTDLPDEVARLPEFMAANGRIRREGTRNLLTAAAAARASRVLAQSIAWPLEGDAQASVEEHERLVLDANGVVLRYGQLYGPGTYFEHELPAPPRVHIDTAAKRTVELLDMPPGVVEILD
jgi:nucleoside-diphosphate-sugar epimerase